MAPEAYPTSPSESGSRDRFFACSLASFGTTKVLTVSVNPLRPDVTIEGGPTVAPPARDSEPFIGTLRRGDRLYFTRWPRRRTLGAYEPVSTFSWRVIGLIGDSRVSEVTDLHGAVCCEACAVQCRIL